MADETEVIRRQMEDTRTALSEKVEAVEEIVASAVKETAQSVSQTVETVTSTVENTVNTVKDAVSGSVQSLKDALDVSACVDKHPWMSVAGAVALGYTIGCLVGPSNGHKDTSSSTSGTGWGGPSPSQQPAAASGISSALGATLSSLIPDGWREWMDKLQGMAIGTAAGVVGEMAMNMVPEQLKPELSKMVDEATQRLGGTVLRHH